MVSHQLDTLMAPFVATKLFAGKIITANPRPARARPAANFAGLDGFAFRFPSPVHSAAKTGAKMMMKNELIDWYHRAGTSKPQKLRSVKSFAKRFRDVGACSKAAQKIAAAMNRTK